MAKNQQSQEIHDLIQECPVVAQTRAIAQLLTIVEKLNERCDCLEAKQKSASAVINELVGRTNE